MKNKFFIKSALKMTSFLMLVLSISLNSFTNTNAWFTSTVTGANSQVTTGDWTAPEVTWINPQNNDLTKGIIQLEATCDGTGSESQYVNFWWYKSSEGQTVTGTDSARENHQYHYVRRSNPNGGTVNGNTFTWNLDTTDENLISPNLDWDGDWRFRAACKDAYNNYSHAEINVNIDNTAPVVEITNPLDTQTVSGTVDIRGTVTDANPHYYWLVVQRTDGAYIAGPGVVNNTNSFTNQSLYNWNTNGLPDGQYVIKLEARDEIDNKEPNQAPVPNDPEVSGDSVDWITVNVDNQIDAPTGLKIYEGHGEDKTLLGCGQTTHTTQITIKWDANQEDNLAYYWFGTRFNSHHRKVYPPTHQYEGNMTPGYDYYYYTVIAVDDQGNESPISDQCWLYLDLDSPEEPETSPIVLNEVMYNPTADNDNGNMPEGEWVELYNNSDEDVDVANWYVKDVDGYTESHKMTVSPDNSDNYLNPFDEEGETIVPANGYLVVYRNGSGIFNNGGDTVELYDSDDDPIDSVTYEGSKSDGNSLARDPDGTGDWVDPYATPGRTNVVDYGDLDPQVKIWQQDTNNSLIGLFDAVNYKQASCTITYQHQEEGSSDPVGSGFLKTINIDNTNIYEKDLYMGTESGGIPNPHTNISDVNVECYLTGSGIATRQLNASLEGDWQE